MMHLAIFFQVFKHCTACGRPFTRYQWDRLLHIGDWPTEDDNGAPITLEMRNCPCGGTLAIEKRNP